MAIPPAAISFSEKHFQATKHRRRSQPGDATVANNRRLGCAATAGTFNKVETLVVSQAYPVHHKIAALLTEIREVTGAKQE